MTDTRNPGDLQATIDRLGLTTTSQFVPFSASRNAAEKFPSLNWKVTLLCNGREVLTTDYMAGSAHAPSYKQTLGRDPQEKRDRDSRVAWECENGRPAPKFGNLRNRAIGPATIEPKASDVIYSLVMDSDVLDSGGFESWASDHGFDADSRKAEAIYRACLDIALKLRAAIGDAGLSALRDAFQDY